MVVARVPMSIVPSRCHQPLNFGFSQVFPRRFSGLLHFPMLEQEGGHFDFSIAFALTADKSPS